MTHESYMKLKYQYPQRKFSRTSHTHAFMIGLYDTVLQWQNWGAVTETGLAGKAENIYYLAPYRESLLPLM